MTRSLLRPRRRTHDPECDAAEYLAGELRLRDRQRFDEHLFGCEECWREVRLGRRGRAIAESARELAPPPLRESVRAAVALAEGPHRRRHAALALTVAVVVAAASIVGLAALRRQHQPAAISAALASFRSMKIPAGAPPTLPAPDLGQAGLTPGRSGRTTLGGLAVDMYSYRSASGERVLVLLSSAPFPDASGATERTGSTQGWQATEDGVALRCSDSPLAYLLMGRDPELLQRAEAALAAQVPTLTPF